MPRQRPPWRRKTFQSFSCAAAFPAAAAPAGPPPTTSPSAHQGAAAVMVGQDFSTIRKFFSLSEKYAAWAHYKVPAVGFGSHAWLLRHPQTVRLTQAELEAHPERRLAALLVAMAPGSVREVATDMPPTWSIRLVTIEKAIGNTK